MLSPVMQAEFARVRVHKPIISERTTRRCLSRKLGWRYGRHKNRMYIDGHEQWDVVEYREQFVERFKEYKRQFHTRDDAGIESLPSGFLVPRVIGCFCLVLITHDESTFYQNDQRNIHWGCPGGNNTPKPKGEGASLMVSDFLTADWGRLCDANRCVFFSLSLSTNSLTFTQQSAFYPQAWEEQRRLVYSRPPSSAG